MPQAHGFGTQSRVRHLQDDAADVLFGEEVGSGELQIIQGTFGVEEKRIASPASEESIVAVLCHTRVHSVRDRRSIDNDLPLFANARCFFPLNPTDRSQLSAV